MKNLIVITAIILNFSFTYSQEKQIGKSELTKDLERIITDLSQNYVYLKEKKVDLDCIRKYYGKSIENIKTKEQAILFFEHLLDEFYDSHLILNTNTKASFRLYSPIYVTMEKGKPVISNVWQTQPERKLNRNIIGAQVKKFNGIDFDKVIDEFPTHCNEKASHTVREWIANKILAGRYNQPRVLTLQLTNKKIIELDLDVVKPKKETELLSVGKISDIGVIRINNSLGRDEFVKHFDKALNTLFNTKGLILDLRNTVSGGNTYNARGIMGRFIVKRKPYQRHSFMEKSQNNPQANPLIERSWVEYVSPRGKQYKNPVIILVGRWTGSMGEGIAIGFEGMGRAEVVGSEMERLAGEISPFSFINQDFGYRISTAKLFHINGTAREKYVPTHYVKQSTTLKDETFEEGIKLISKMTK